MLLAVIGNCIYAQDVKNIKKMEINGNVYNYESKVNHIYAAKNKIKIEKTCETAYVEPDSNNYINNIVKKVFTADRIQELAENRYTMTLTFYCNKGGNVLEVKFFTHDLAVSEKGDQHSLSIEEVDLLDKEIKKQKIDLKNTCPDVKYYLFIGRVKFMDISQN